MKNWFISSVFAGLLVLSSFGQTNPNQETKKFNDQKNSDPIEKMLTRLGVDNSKKEKIIAIVNQSKNDLAKVSIQMDRKKLDLKEMMLNGNVDLAKMRQNCDERGKIWADMQFLSFTMDNEIKKNLTPEQWNQYIQLKISRNENHPLR